MSTQTEFPPVPSSAQYCPTFKSVIDAMGTDQMKRHADDIMATLLNLLDDESYPATEMSPYWQGHSGSLAVYGMLTTLALTHRGAENRDLFDRFSQMQFLAARMGDTFIAPEWWLNMDEPYELVRKSRPIKKYVERHTAFCPCETVHSYRTVKIDGADDPDVAAALGSVMWLCSTCNRPVESWFSAAAGSINEFQFSDGPLVNEVVTAADLKARQDHFSEYAIADNGVTSLFGIREMFKLNWIGEESEW